MRAANLAVLPDGVLHVLQKRRVDAFQVQAGGALQHGARDRERAARARGDHERGVSRASRPLLGGASRHGTSCLLLRARLHA